MTGIPASQAAILRELHQPVRASRFRGLSDAEFEELRQFSPTSAAPVCATCIHHVSGYPAIWPTATDRAIHQLPGDDE